MQFLSTPSARRATICDAAGLGTVQISIHALREEGDDRAHRRQRFLEISIHALREEGDVLILLMLKPLLNFYPRPPRGGRLQDFTEAPHTLAISIHALREEGDFNKVHKTNLKYISIHALREEGDEPGRPDQRHNCYFYPRPPRGGRPASVGFAVAVSRFLSTPSARRATKAGEPVSIPLSDFYPRPPRGGRPNDHLDAAYEPLFLSTPSARRATVVWYSLGWHPEISIHALREEGD